MEGIRQGKRKRERVRQRLKFRMRLGMGLLLGMGLRMIPVKIWTPIVKDLMTFQATKIKIQMIGRDNTKKDEKMKAMRWENLMRMKMMSLVPYLKARQFIGVKRRG